MQQVLAAETNGAGLVAVAVAAQTPLSTSAMTGSAVLVPDTTAAVAERAALLASAEAGGAASSPAAFALVTHLHERRVRHSDLLHLVGVSLRQRHRDVPRRGAHTVLRTVHRLTVVGLKLPGAGSGLGVGLQSIPVHCDGLQIFEGEVPGRFGAVIPFGFHKFEQSISGYIL